MIKFKLLVAIFMVFFIELNAQVDLKINPIGTLFKQPEITLDFAITDNFSVETGIGYNGGNFSIDGIEYERSGFKATAIARTYFRPEDGADKFGIGLYTRYANKEGEVKDSQDAGINNYTQERLTVGFLTGWKWVSRNNILLELGVGVGRAMINDIKFENPDRTTLLIDDIRAVDLDVWTRLAIGYRF